MAHSVVCIYQKERVFVGIAISVINCTGVVSRRVSNLLRSPPFAETRVTQSSVCYRTSSQAGGILTSQLKAANGVVGGAGLELSTPPLGAGSQLTTQDIQGLFINQHVGYATQPAAATQNHLQIVKREPEDLSHHRKLESPNSGSLDGSIIISKQPRHKVIISHTCRYYLGISEMFTMIYVLVIPRGHRKRCLPII